MVDEETKAAKCSAAHSSGMVSIKDTQAIWKVGSCIPRQPKSRAYFVDRCAGFFRQSHDKSHEVAGCRGLPHLAMSFAVAPSLRSDQQAARKEKES